MNLFPLFIILMHCNYMELGRQVGVSYSLVSSHVCVSKDDTSGTHGIVRKYPKFYGPLAAYATRGMHISPTRLRGMYDIHIYFTMPALGRSDKLPSAQSGNPASCFLGAWWSRRKFLAPRVLELARPSPSACCARRSTTW